MKKITNVDIAVLDEIKKKLKGCSENAKASNLQNKIDELKKAQPEVLVLLNSYKGVADQAKLPAGLSAYIQLSETSLNAWSYSIFLTPFVYFRI